MGQLLRIKRNPQTSLPPSFPAPSSNTTKERTVKQHQILPPSVPIRMDPTLKIKCATLFQRLSDETSHVGKVTVTATTTATTMITTGAETVAFLHRQQHLMAVFLLSKTRRTRMLSSSPNCNHSINRREQHPTAVATIRTVITIQRDPFKRMPWTRNWSRSDCDERFDASSSSKFSWPENPWWRSIKEENDEW